MKIFTMPVMGIVLLLFFSTDIIVAQSIKTISQSEKAEIVQHTLLLLSDNYIFPERIPEVERILNEKWQYAKIDSAQHLELFLDTLNHQVESTAHDTHIKIFYDPVRVSQIKWNAQNETAGKEAGISPAFLKRMQYENFRLRKVERIDGNIGYFNLLNFPPLAPAKESIISAMNFLTYANALIIDLRDNGGGYAESMHFMLSYFLPDSTIIAEWRYRKDNERVTTYVPKDEQIHKFSTELPLYLLVGENTSSAAESFAYTLQQYGRAIIIGEKTQGELNPGQLFPLNDDLYIMIPTVESINPVSKTSIDGIGITPDIQMETDKALKCALLQAYSTLAKKTTDAEYKSLCEWEVANLTTELENEQ